MKYLNTITIMIFLFALSSCSTGGNHPDFEANVENNSEEIEKKPEKKIKRESFLDKLTKNLQDFLDNAE